MSCRRTGPRTMYHPGIIYKQLIYNDSFALSRRWREDSVPSSEQSPSERLFVSPFLVRRFVSRETSGVQVCVKVLKGSGRERRKTESQSHRVVTRKKRHRSTEGLVSNPSRDREVDAGQRTGTGPDLTPCMTSSIRYPLHERNIRFSFPSSWNPKRLIRVCVHSRHHLRDCESVCRTQT